MSQEQKRKLSERTKNASRELNTLLNSLHCIRPTHCIQQEPINIQLFRERLSEKVHATNSKDIVGGFEFSVFQRNLKELERKAMEMCLRVLKESNKRGFNSYIRQEQCIDYIPYYLSGLSRAHVFRQPFSKQLYTGAVDAGWPPWGHPATCSNGSLWWSNS